MSDLLLYLAELALFIPFLVAVGIIFLMLAGAVIDDDDWWNW